MPVSLDNSPSLSEIVLVLFLVESNVLVVEIGMEKL